MPYFRQLLFLPVLALFALLPRPVHAALIRTYDLESLCYKSTDVVEATFVRQKQADGNYEWVAVVVDSIAGGYRPGDVIMPVSIGLLSPPPFGPCVIVFIARHPSYGPQRQDWAQVVDTLYTDRKNHVRRYYQWNNPGGQEAEGYSPPGIPDAGDSEANYLTLVVERPLIAAKWAEVDKLRPLLSHDPRPEDVPALLALLRHRPDYRPSRFAFRALTDGIAEEICSRLAALKDPAVALDALSIKQGEEVGWILKSEPFETPQDLAYAQTVAADVHEPASRRTAAAEVLRYHAPRL